MNLYALFLSSTHNDYLRCIKNVTIEFIQNYKDARIKVKLQGRIPVQYRIQSLKVS